MDPNAEQLHRLYDEQRASALPSRERFTESIATVLLLVACLAIAALDDWHAPDLLLLAVFVGLYAAFWQVTFKVASIAATPLQILFVPMWFLFDPALLPVIVAAGQVTGNVVTVLRGHGRQRWGRVVLGVPDAWYAMGPAIVLAAFGTQEARLDQWWIYALAFGAQCAVDAITTLARCLAARGTSPRDQFEGIGWIWMVDGALTPLGFVVALSSDQTPYIALAMAPLAGLLALFAKEREDRIQSALELSSAYRGTARLMGDVLEADDAYTGGEHTQGVVELSLAVGRNIGLSAQQLRTLEFGALLHDIGKLRVPNEIINKPGKLTDEEWAIIKLHPGYGQEMLDRVGGELSHAGRVVRAHHERWDGAGYPDGLAADEIPIEARIITVCDSFSAMTTDRSYRKGMRVEEALAELRRCAGTQFDPLLVDELERVVGGSRPALTSVAGGAAPAPDAPSEPAAPHGEPGSSQAA
jgi:HD-GYP domain-containing protein (c-di-GMP phosphodiesterase class II)